MGKFVGRTPAAHKKLMSLDTTTFTKLDKNDIGYEFQAKIDLP